MNEYQKKLMKDAGKNIGLIGISLAVMYMLSGGSIDIVTTFTKADIMGKMFYILFGVVIVYNLGTLISIGIGYAKPNKGMLAQSPIVTNNTIQTPPQQDNAVFERFDNFNLGTDVLGSDDMVTQLKGKVDQFYERLDDDVSDLEDQYKEMVDIRKVIVTKNEELYGLHKKLEQQMQLTQGMIRTKKLMGERVKQLRGK